MMPELPGAVPEIPVSDIAAATTYYRDSLRFSLDWIATDIALVGISLDRCRPRSSISFAQCVLLMSCATERSKWVLPDRET
ncbi:MAG: hypothetical protein ABJB66_15815 [Gemmatimonadaceae bacterium]